MILVMEYCTGVHINDVDGLKRQGLDVYDVSKKIGMSTGFFITKICKTIII